MAVALICSLSPLHSLYHGHTTINKNTYRSLYHGSSGTNYKLILLSQPQNHSSNSINRTDKSSENEQSQTTTIYDDEEEELIDLPVQVPTRDFVTLTACAVGLLTGLGVVLFNTAVHEIRDIFWDGMPLRGASWLREEPFEDIWQRVILVPVSGGIIVGALNSLRDSLSNDEISDESSWINKIKGVFRPLLKAIAASITLGAGNSLGPEGPSVEIGSSIAKGFGNLLKWSDGKRLSLVAAGSAAGISSGFNASVAGCFFAVESVSWPASSDSFSSLPNATPIMILSSVIASVVSQVGLGSDPAFIVPQYDFRSPSELPLYLLLGIICGLVSLTLSTFTSFSLQTISTIQEKTKLPKSIFPALGGLSVGLMALKYPEVLYWGFENVDILLESRPFTNGLSVSLLFQLVGVKIVASSICRASGLVGGYYAPSLFIGAATGMAYGRCVKDLFCGPGALFHVSLLEVASPQAYGLVGMAATLAGVCQVPLTSVLLLFELSQDYRIVLPLLGAVGMSSWISSSRSQNKSKGSTKTEPIYNATKMNNDDDELCLLESSRCVYEETFELNSDLVQSLTVSEAMRKRYQSVSMESPVVEAVNLMLQEKASFVVIVDNDGSLLGLLTLDLIRDFIKSNLTTTINKKEMGEVLVCDVCQMDGNKCNVLPVTSDMSLIEVQKLMDSRMVDQLPVVVLDLDVTKRHVVGVIDRDSINIAFRAMAAKEILNSSFSVTHRRPES